MAVSHDVDGSHLGAIFLVIGYLLRQGLSADQITFFFQLEQPEADYKRATREVTRTAIARSSGGETAFVATRLPPLFFISHGDISGRCGAHGAHEKASPADDAQRRVSNQAYPGVLQLGGTRWSQDVAHDDEGKQDHGDLRDGSVLHLEEAFGSLLHGGMHERGQELREEE